MKVSARNVFEGSVSSVQPGAVNAEVELTLAGGEKLVAVVTMASLHNLKSMSASRPWRWSRLRGWC